jgi:hypothetical protein
MKKLFTFGTMCIVASLLLSSCSSKLSITKRHYNKGYYVDRSENKKASFLKAERALQVKAKTPLYVAQSPVSQNNKIELVQVPAMTNTLTVASNQSHTFAQSRSVPTENTPAAVTEIPAPQIISSVTLVNGVKDEATREGLSLFWLVILIIVILWAFGFGFGVGVFINLLLLIALILLILWLLRIV